MDDDRLRSLSDAVLESAPDAVITVDHRGRVLLINEAAERRFDIDRADTLGRPVERLAIQHGSPWDELAKLLAGEPSDTVEPIVLAARAPDRREQAVEVAVTRAGDPPYITAWVRERRDDTGGHVREALLEAAEELADVGSWDWTPAESRLLWSDNLFRIYGLDVSEVVPTPEYVFSRTHPDDRDRVVGEVAALRLTGELHPLEYRFVRPDGAVRQLLATLSVAERRHGQLYRLVGWVQDVTERRWAEREIAAHVAVAAGLTRWDSLEPGPKRLERGAERLLANLAGAIDFVAGVLWVPVGDVLASRVMWHGGLVELHDFRRVTRRSRLPRGVGLPGRVWERKEPLSMLTIAGSTSDPRRSVAVDEGLRGAVAVPAIAGEEVMAVIELLSREEVELTRSLKGSLTAIGYELGQFLANRRGDLTAPVLTPRELEVLRLAAHGLSATRTAERLVVSPRTVRTHLEHIYAKLGAADKTEAVASAIRYGLIE